MSVKILEDSFSKEKYNEVALHPLQTWEWGEARKKVGVEVVRLGEFVGNELKNVFQLTLHKLPFLNFKIAYLPRSVWPSKEVLNYLAEFAEENKLIFIKLEPYVRKGKNNTQKDNRLIKSSHFLFPDWTQILDIQKSEEDLLKNMKSKTRYNIRLAEKKGVTVKNMTNHEGFDIFIKLYFKTTKRQGYFGHNLDYHKAIFNNLKKSVSHLLIAFYKNIPVCAYQIFIFKNTGYYVYGGSSEEYKNTMAANLLMWKSIKFAKQKGAKYFDMWGSLPLNYNQKHPWAGFTRFKEGYGGEFVELVGSYDLTKNKMYRLYSVLYKFREFYLNLRANFAF